MGRERLDLPLTAMAVVLTVGTGAVDAASFIRLGGVFSSVMTGNLVVSGYAIGTGDLGHLLTTVTAVIGYVLGVAAGTGVAGRGGMIAVLGAELLALVAFAVGWEVTGGRPSAVALHVLLVLTAMAMGLQSAAMRALGGRRVVSTTYLTGTLTGVIAALLTSGGLAGAMVRDIAILTAVVVGAAAGTLVVTLVPAALPAIPLVTVLAALTMAGLTRPR
ncbi:YoaK family protein [Nonomuraea sp. C10]|uniref:YoaK family protein n=1 Tax=Nonomuraea sp. C10 TaxID=2600577 RepID=UPI0011CDAE96|nr:YoaK family protein [Nonomuraea sp. C10]TXK33984.1 DUF1275 domain-containing protein [Nonomuraea sp. C10]